MVEGKYVGVQYEMPQPLKEKENDDVPGPGCGIITCDHDPIVNLTPTNQPWLFKVMYCAQHATIRIAELLRERGVQ